MCDLIPNDFISTTLGFEHDYYFDMGFQPLPLPVIIMQEQEQPCNVIKADLPAYLLGAQLQRRPWPVIVSNDELNILWTAYIQWFHNQNIKSTTMSHFEICHDYECTVVGCVNIRLLRKHIAECTCLSSCIFCLETHEYSLQMIRRHDLLSSERQQNIERLRVIISRFPKEMDDALFKMCVFPSIYVTRMRTDAKALVREWKYKKTFECAELAYRQSAPKLPTDEEVERRMMSEWIRNTTNNNKMQDVHATCIDSDTDDDCYRSMV
jgi:hypothetical protein